MKKITLALDADVKPIEAKFKGVFDGVEARAKRINAEIARMNQQSIKAEMPAGFDKERLAEFRRVSDQLKKIDADNLKAQQKHAELAARAQIQAKQSELRQFENAEKSKQRIVEISAKGQLQAQNNAFKSLEASKKREYQEFVRLEREKSKVAAAEARKRSGFLSSFGGKLSGAGESLQNAGTGALATITAPLIAIGTLGVKAAMNLDTVRQKFVGVEGSAEAANKKIKELQDFAANTKGVTFEQASATYEQLKPLKIDEGVIKKQTQALGAIGQGADFSRNLLQIFQQGFERGDIKEAIGRMPLFETVLNEVAAKFGQKDAAGLKKLKESGKLTVDQFLSGFADSINNNPNFANIGESFSVKLTKALEIVNNALAPVGEIILNGVLPAVSQAIPYIQQLSNYFAALSPSVQTTVVAIAAFIAALAPGLVIVGSVLSAVGGLITTFAAFETALLAATGTATLGAAFTALFPIIAGVTAAIAAIGLAVGALYLAWETNFGGIRELTATVAETVSNLWNQAVTEISAYTATELEKAKQFWAENGADIMKAAETASDNVKEAWQSVVAFWSENSEEIKAVTSAAWSIIKTIISTAVSNIGQIIKLISAVINGDFGKAFDALKQIAQNGLNAAIEIIKASASLVWGAVKLIFEGIWSQSAYVAEKAAEIGTNLVQGIIKGIKNKASGAYDEARNLASGVIDVLRTVPIIRSPSKVTTEIGEFISEGLANGIQNKAGLAKVAAKKVADETIKILSDAQKEFAKLAGMSSAQVGRTLQTETTQQGSSDLQEILKLRNEMRNQPGMSPNAPLPSSPETAAAELANLKRKKEALDSVGESYEKLRESVKATTKLGKDEQDDLADRIKKSQDSGAANVLQLSKEIELLGITDEFEKQRIENAYILKALRQDLMNDGFSEDQINQVVKAQKAANAGILELTKLKAGKQSQIEAAEKQATEAKRLADEYAQYVERMGERIEDSMLNIFDGFKGGLKSGFRSIWQEIKSFTDDIVGNLFKNLSQNIAKSVFGGGGNNQSSGGGILGSIKGLFGIGGASSGGLFGGSTPPFVGSFAGSSSSTGGFSNLSQIPDLLSGLGGSGAMARGGSNSLLSSLFGKKNLSTTLGGIGMGANLLGGLIGGRTGGVLSGAGAGLALGAQIGSIIPGLGTAIGGAVGAAVGGLAGLFSGIFGTSKKRKEQERIHDSAMVQALDSLNQLKAALDRRPPSVDPDSALTQAAEVQNAYFQTVGALTDAKTKNISIKDGNERIRPLYAQIQSAAMTAKAFNVNRQNVASSFTGEFANGGVIGATFANQYGEFKRRYGILSGGIPNVDSIPILGKAKEMMLNEQHQRDIINGAGYDVFAAHTSIPNYPKAAPPVLKMETGGFIGSQPASSRTVNTAPQNEQPMNVIFELSLDREGLFKAGLSKRNNLNRIKHIAIGAVRELMRDGRMPDTIMD